MGTPVITHPPLSPLHPLYTVVAVTPDVQFDTNNEQVATFRVAYTMVIGGTFEVTVPQVGATVESIDEVVLEQASLIADIFNLSGPDVIIAPDGKVELSAFIAAPPA